MQGRLVRPILAATLLALAPPAGAAAERYSERFARTYPADAGIEVVVGNTNGSVSVVVWERQAVELVAEKTADSRSAADAREALAELEIVVREGPGRLEIETRQPSRSDGFLDWLFGRARNVAVRYELRVPPGAELDLRTVNGSVETDGAGHQRLRTTNGKIKVRDARLDVTAHSTNGGIDVELLADPGAIEVDLGTTNGAISLALGPDLGGRLEARTVNGSVRSELPLTRSDGANRRRVSGQINGGGEARITLRTTNGSIRILDAA